jgi:hypothetical protein
MIPEVKEKVGIGKEACGCKYQSNMKDRQKCSALTASMSIPSYNIEQ